MKLNKLLITSIFIFLLAGCMKSDEALRRERDVKTEGAFEGKLIEPKAMVDQKKFIKESNKRIEETSELGPKITEIDDTNTREEASTLISKDEAKNYVTLEDKGNIFPIDINVQNVDIRTFTQILAKLTGINFLVSDEVNGNVTAQLHDVPWPNVLDSVLNLKSLAKHVDNNANIIRIHSQEAIVKLETFERQRREDLQKALALDQATQPFYTEIFKLFYAKPDKMKALLSEVLGISPTATASSAGTPTTQITVDARMNQIIIKARKEDIEIAKKLIAKLDSRTKQIFIEAFIVEASDQFSKALGTTLGANLNRVVRTNGQNFYTGVAGVASSTSTAVAAGTSDSLLTSMPAVGATSGVSFLGGLGSAATLKLELTAAANESLSKIISNPRIFTLDNQQAVIFQGSEIPYTTTSSDGTKIEFKEAGLKLAVTPSVVGDGNLMMAIEVNKDTADTSITNPPITQSRITTNLVTKDGSVVVIGGIYTQTKTDGYDKVPGLGDIPFAGKLFRRDSNSNNRKELMIFMSPKTI